MAVTLSVLNEHPVVLQATSWALVLTHNRDMQNKHGMTRPEGLCDLVKIFDHSSFQGKLKKKCKNTFNIKSLLNIQNNPYFRDRKIKLVPVKFCVKTNDEIGHRFQKHTLHVSI